MNQFITHAVPLASFGFAALTVCALILHWAFTGSKNGDSSGIWLRVASVTTLVGAGALLSYWHNHTGESLGWLFGTETQDVGISEWGSFLCFAAISFVSIAIALNTGGVTRLVFAVLGVLCAVIAGEEISWGQWVFHWSTPAGVLDANLQAETNVHNFVDPRIYDLVYMALGWTIILVVAGFRFARNIVLGLMKPLAPILTAFGDWIDNSRFGLTLLLYSAVLLQHELFEELSEMVLAAAVLLFVIWFRQSLKPKTAAPS